MNNVPGFLTRYYVRGEYPFNSLNDLPLNQANEVKLDASNRYDWGGFYAQDDYLVHRREIEKWIYSHFTNRDVYPPNNVPVYMFLGDVDWPFTKFGEETSCLRIPLHELDTTMISFIWPDSMYEPIVDQTGRYTGDCQRTNQPKVYLIDELDELIKELDLFKAVSNCGIIEAQVWDRNMLNTWYQKAVSAN